jgi:outer membrane protein assembly factor BamB
MRLVDYIIRQPSLPRDSFVCLLTYLAASALAACPSAARSQVVTAAVSVGEEAADPARSFTLPLSRGETIEALDDFRRHSKRAAWDRAFKALDKVLESPSAGLSPRGDGLVMPIRSLVLEELAALPPAGLEAYRLFHDAEAKALFAQAKQGDETEKLKKIFSQYLLTSVGDVASDTLGDIYFEQGTLDKAIACWQSVLRYHPNSNLPRVRLLTKCAIAAARSGAWDQFQQFAEQVRTRHGDERVTLGGREVVASEHLAALAKEQSGNLKATGSSDAPLPADLRLSSGDEILWQFRFLSARDIQTLAALGQNWGWRVRFPAAEMVPPAVTDGQRIYVNLLGHLFAVDLETGKLVWRSAKFHHVAEKLQHSQQHSPEHYSLALADGRLWTISRALDELGQHGAAFHLSRLDPATGKVAWTTRTIGSLKAWSIGSQPLVVGDRVFVTGAKTEKPAELHALAIKASDGKLLWTTPLGTAQSDQGFGFNRMPQPALVWHNNKLLVDTHAGAFLALDGQSGVIEWALAYESDPAPQNYYYGQQFPPTTAGHPFVAGNTLYFKGMRSPRLYALDLVAPAILWKRPVDQSAMIVGIDRDTIFLSGFSGDAGGEKKSAAMAYELNDRQRLKWFTPLAPGSSWMHPLVTEHRLYQFTSRGIYQIDRTTGDTSAKPFYGADLNSLGGVLILTPGKLLAISNLAITAYRVE